TALHAARSLSGVPGSTRRGRFRSLQWSHPAGRRPAPRGAVAEAAVREAPARGAPAREAPVREAPVPEAAMDPLERAIREIGFPEVPGVSAVEEARILLQAAAEVEHALLVQYLYSMYSLDVTDPIARGWMFAIRDIAKEEMGHLIAVQNLLLAIGGAVY